MGADTESVDRLWKDACALDLEGRNFCCVFTLEQKAAAYNGCGPAWFPAKIRKFLDGIFAEFACCFLLHDIEWSNSDGTDGFFAWSNEALKRNCMTVANARHAWYSPLRYIRRHQANVVYAACRDFGRSAYNTAYFESVTKPREREAK